MLLSNGFNQNSNKMKPIQLILFTVVFASLFLSCSKTIYENVWQGKSVKVDGNTEQWQLPLRYFNESGKLHYTVTNDAENLYVCVIADDMQKQMRFFRAGFEVWIDTLGKSKKHTGILFPVPSKQPKGVFPKDSVSLKELIQVRKPDNLPLKSRFGSSLKEMKLVGFKAPINGLTPLNNNSGISAGIDWDKLGVMTYEAVIPFKTFYKATLSPADNAKVFSVTFVIPAIAGMSSPGGSSVTPGSEMGAGGGRGAGGNGRSGGGRTSGGFSKYGGFSSDASGSNGSSESTFITVKFKPAVTPK